MLCGGVDGRECTDNRAKDDDGSIGESSSIFENCDSWSIGEAAAPAFAVCGYSGICSEMLARFDGRSLNVALVGENAADATRFDPDAGCSGGLGPYDIGGCSAGRGGLDASCCQPAIA